MAIANIRVLLDCEIEKVWDMVTNLEDCSWRSDLARIEVLQNKQFVEYTKEGYATTFTVTVEVPYQRWEFDMENANMRGHWAGIFTRKGGQTEIDFTEEVTARNPLMNVFLKLYLKKQQARYVSDLKKALL